VCSSGTCTAPTGTGGTTGSTGGSTGTGGTTGTTGGSTGTGGTTGTTGGTTGTGGLGGTGTGGNTGAHFSGSGNGYRPLTTGCGPDTADECTGTCEQTGGVDSTVVRPPATLCFSAPNDPTPEDPALIIEQVIETINGVTYVHIRIIFDPYYTDNSYGAGACCGWGRMRGHTFNDDLTKSDHTELQITDGAGNVVMNFKIDYVSADPNQPCGYGSLGATGGDGLVILGDPSAIVEVTTSIERNLNGCGYCTSDACAPSGDCTIDSPSTDATFTPNPLTPNWDYRNVYEFWLLADAFGSAGFGQAFVTYVHASPSKISADMTLTPAPCPPTYDTPYCPPGVTQEGGNCFGTGGSGGAGGSGGDGGTPVCAVNFQLYITTEGAAICTPIPYANYPNHAACPTGYVLDIATEGQYCVPG
jgi:hypothetical protein